MTSPSARRATGARLTRASAPRQPAHARAAGADADAGANLSFNSGSGNPSSGHSFLTFPHEVLLPFPVQAQTTWALWRAVSNRDTKPTLWFVRHGESTWNAAGLVQGQAHGPVLTAKGRREAARAAENLGDASHQRDLHQRPGAGPRDGGDHRARARACRCRATRAARAELRSGPGPPARRAGRPRSSGIEGDRVVDADARPPEGESLREMYERVGDVHRRTGAACTRRRRPRGDARRRDPDRPGLQRRRRRRRHGLGPGPQRKCLGPRPSPTSVAAVVQ